MAQYNRIVSILELCTLYIATFTIPLVLSLRQPLTTYASWYTTVKPYKSRPSAAGIIDLLSLCR